MQRRATKLVWGMENLQYEERFKKLEEEDIAKSYSREEADWISFSYKEVCVCKPNCGKMECFT